MRVSGARLAEPRLVVSKQPASEMENKTTAAMTTNFMFTAPFLDVGVHVGDQVFQPC
jgi:hypothetical protein